MSLFSVFVLILLRLPFSSSAYFATILVLIRPVVPDSRMCIIGDRGLVTLWNLDNIFFGFLCRRCDIHLT